ncbi:MAG: YjbQ family protein [Chloroflexi bacterium]|nr:YjbQ family protein [Ktedonobacteraceae bacterium]MBV9707310.1 YjbQ family protein [Chloroflexota bacterium]
MGASCHLPIIERNLELGQWQRIFLVELDSPRSKAGCCPGERSSRTVLRKKDRWRESGKERRKDERSGTDYVSVHSLCGATSKRAPERGRTFEDAFLFPCDP